MEEWQDWREKRQWASEGEMMEGKNAERGEMEEDNTSELNTWQMPLAFCWMASLLAGVNQCI